MPTSADRSSYEFTPHRLGNGLILEHLPSEKWKTEIVDLYFLNPIDGGTAARALAANLLRHGSDRVRGMTKTAECLQDLYGATLSSFVTRTSQYQIFVLRVAACAQRWLPGRLDALAGTLDLAENVLTSPWAMHDDFPRRDFDNEHKNLLRAIDAIADSKPQHAERRLVEELFKGHQLAVPAWGFRDDVARLTPHDVREAFRSMVKSAPCLVYAVTPRNLAATAAMVEKKLPLPRRKAYRAMPFESPLPRKKSHSVVETEDISQTRIAAAFRIKGYDQKRDGYPGILADILFGGESTSRLFKTVREKHSLAYSIGSSFDDRTGTLYVFAGVDRGSRPRAMECVRHEIADIAAGNIKTEEIDLALRAIERMVRSALDTQSGVIGFHLGRLLSGRREKTPEALINRYGKITRDEMASVFERAALDTEFILESTSRKKSKGSTEEFDDASEEEARDEE